MMVYLVLILLLSQNCFTNVLGLLRYEDRPNETRLREDLLEFYDPFARPTYNFSSATKLETDIALHQIIDVDEKHQIFQASLWLRMYWKDEFLTWNPDDYGGLTSTEFATEKLWVPDICIYDAWEPAIYANPMDDFFISVDHEGNAKWLASVVMQSICHYNVRHFPYDTQSCTLTVGSWTYTGAAVDYWTKADVGDLVSYKENVEWEIVSFTATRTVQFYSCCSEPYPLLDYKVTLRRRPGFYVIYLYIPAVVIVVSSMFAFYLPPGSDAKVDLAVTGLLSQTVFLLLISDLMPPDSENLPALGQCLTTLLVIQAVAVIVIVIIKRVHDDSIYKTKPPSKSLCTIMHYLRYPFLLWHIEYRRSESEDQLPGTIPKLQEHSNGGYESDRENTRNLGHLKADNTHNGGMAHRNINGGVLNDNQETTTEVMSIKDGILGGNDFYENGGTKDDHVEHIIGMKEANMETAIVRTLSELLKETKREREKKRAEQLQEDIAQQWKHITAMYDRILFVVFFMLVLAITAWFVTQNQNDE